MYKTNSLLSKKTMLTACIILLLTLSPLTIIKKVNALETVISVPLESTAEPGEMFWIDVYIVDVEELHGYDVKIYFDPSILHTDEEWVESGLFLEEFGETTGIKATVEPGYIKVTDQFKKDEGPAYGEGTLFYLQFAVFTPGRSDLELRETKLWKPPPDMERIDHTTEDGVFYTNTPRADFTYNYTDMNLRKPIVDEPITFNASSSYDPNPGGAIVEYDWDFGDGTTKTYIEGVNLTAITTHNFSEAKDYTVELTVWDNEGKKHKAWATILVVFYDLAVTDIKVDPPEATIGTIVQINVTVTNHGTTYIDFNLTVYYDNTLIWFNKTEGKSAFSLPLEMDPDWPGMRHPMLGPDESLTVTFNWNTTNVIGTLTYQISANASILVSNRHDVFLEGVDKNEDNNYFEATSKIIAPHDIAVANIDISPKAAYTGSIVNINVTIVNEGTEPETFAVTVYANSSVIETRLDVYLAPGEQIILSFAWNTSGVVEGTYVIHANTTIVPDEMDTIDNEFIGGFVIITTTPIHDIAIINVQVSPSQVYIGGSISINVTLENQGTEPETFAVTVYANSSVIETRLDVYLAPGEQIILSFAWNTSGVVEGTYVIHANTTIVPGEEDQQDNIHIWGTVEITINIIDNEITIADVTFHIIIETNSDVTEFEFNQENKEISFNVTVTFTPCFYNVTIPKKLLGGPFTVKVDEIEVSFEISEDTTHSFIYLTCDLGTHKIQIIGTTVATPPTALFSFSPEHPVVGETVTFDASASDDDGNIESYRWYFGDGASAEGKIVYHAYSSVSSYTITLIVTDDTQMSTTIQKEISVEIINSSISISVNPPTITIGQSITINGTITPERVGTEVTIQYRVSGEETWINITTVVTSEQSQYLYSWTPPVAGTYEIQTIWLGDANATSAQSIIVTVVVNKVSSTISIEVSMESATVGSNITISGTITPAKEDVNVIIQYRLAEGEWNTLAIVTTDANGHFSYTWLISEEGTYEIKARWTGDQNTIGSESLPPVNVEAVPPTAPSVPLYTIVAGVVLAAAIAAALFYFTKIRKP